MGPVFSPLSLRHLACIVKAQPCSCNNLLLSKICLMALLTVVGENSRLVECLAQETTLNLECYWRALPHAPLRSPTWGSSPAVRDSPAS